VQYNFSRFGESFKDIFFQNRRKLQSNFPTQEEVLLPFAPHLTICYQVCEELNSKFNEKTSQPQWKAWEIIQNYQGTTYFSRPEFKLFLQTTF
jgi:hypothetical protein